MAVYYKQTDDITTGQSLVDQMSDDEVVEVLGPHLKITSSKPTVQLNGENSVTITLQLVSLPLSDDRVRNITKPLNVILVEDQERTSVMLDSTGKAELLRAFATTGTYSFSPYSLPGNTLTITVV